MKSLINKKEKNNWPLVGNRRVAEFLEKSLATDSLSGAYIFCGPKDLGKTAAAVFFTQVLLCKNRQTGSFTVPCGKCASCRQFSSQEDYNHSLTAAHGDFHVLKKNSDKKNISVEGVRDFISSLSMSSFSGGYKVGLIKEADDLNQEGANALLKTLEEPRAKVIIILTVSRLDILPKTIISRSQVLRFSPVKFSEIHDFLIEERNFSRDSALDAAKLSLGRPALAAKFAEDRDFRLKYSEAVDCFLNFFKQGIAQRFKGVDLLLSSRGELSQVDRVFEIISVWRGVARDLLLSASELGNLSQNHDRLNFLEEIKQHKELSYWPELLRKIDQAEIYLRSNVNPHLVLEGIAVGI